MLVIIWQGLPSYSLPTVHIEFFLQEGKALGTAALKHLLHDVVLKVYYLFIVVLVN